VILGGAPLRLAPRQIVRTPFSTLSARRSAHCPHAVQHIVDICITPKLNSSSSEAGRDPPLELGQIVRTPSSTLSARRSAHCPHAVQHIVRRRHGGRTQCPPGAIKGNSPVYGGRGACACRARPRDLVAAARLGGGGGMAGGHSVLLGGSKAIPLYMGVALFWGACRARLRDLVAAARVGGGGMAGGHSVLLGGSKAIPLYTPPAGRQNRSVTARRVPCARMAPCAAL
jgi:hypothetical protein